MIKSKLTKKDMLIIIIKAQGSCLEISSLHCQGAVVGNQRHTACPCSDYCKAHMLSMTKNYAMAVNKFVEKYGQDALVEALM